MTHNAFTLVALALTFGSGAAHAECGIEAGSVRILSNDFPALHAVAAAAMECAGSGVSVTANATAEHQSIQVPALTVDPAEYTVAVVANDSIPPLLAGGLIRPLDDLVAAYGEGLDPSQLIKVNGETVAIAFMVNAQHLTYRRDVLDAAGVAPPRTYEEVLAAAEAIRDAGLMDTPLGAGNGAGWDLAAEFVNMYLGLGGELFEPGTAVLAIDPAKGARALEMMKALSAYMPADNLTFDTNALAALYQQGRVGIMNMWGSRAASLVGDEALPEVAANTAFAGAPTVGGGTIPATALWWDGFSIAANVSDEDAEASFRAMVHAIQLPTAEANPDAAAWLIPGFEPGPTAAGVLESARAGARPYPIEPWMGVLHGVLGDELAGFMTGSEDAAAALEGVAASYEAGARQQGFLP